MPLVEDRLLLPTFSQPFQGLGSQGLQRTAAGHPWAGFCFVGTHKNSPQQYGSELDQGVPTKPREGSEHRLHPQVAFSRKAPGQLSGHFAKQAMAIDQDSSQLGSEQLYRC